MAYEFKKLSDVEALAEVPDGALAIVEVNGELKRAPIGGGNANLEEMMVDLDIDYSCGNNYFLATMEQVKKAYDSNMNIYAAGFTDVSGKRYTREFKIINLKDCMSFSVQSNGDVFGHLKGTDDNFSISINCDSNDYTNSVITPISATINLTNGITLTRLYASIF